jgi:hypothetical protein
MEVRNKTTAPLCHKTQLINNITECLPNYKTKQSPGKKQEGYKHQSLMANTFQKPSAF